MKEVNRSGPGSSAAPTHRIPLGAGPDRALGLHVRAPDRVTAKTRRRRAVFHRLLERHVSGTRVRSSSGMTPRRGSSSLAPKRSAAIPEQDDLGRIRCGERHDGQWAVEGRPQRRRDPPAANRPRTLTLAEESSGSQCGREPVVSRRSPIAAERISPKSSRDGSLVAFPSGKRDFGTAYRLSQDRARPRRCADGVRGSGSAELVATSVARCPVIGS